MVSVEIREIDKRFRLFWNSSHRIFIEVGNHNYFLHNCALEFKRGVLDKYDS